MKFFYFFAILLIAACGTTKKIPVYVEPTTGRIVQLQTEYGNMTIALNDSTPLHRNNFMKLVKENFYDSLLFHRVIGQFMIQGGDPKSKYAQQGTALGSGGKDYRVPAEFRPYLFHGKGALAAARDGNPEKASSSCQFYIVQGKKFSDEEIKQQFYGKQLSDTAHKVYTTIGGTPFLDMNYTVFGQVTEGLDVVDKIAAIQCDGNNRPLKDVRMKMVVIH